MARQTRRRPAPGPARTRGPAVHARPASSTRNLAQGGTTQRTRGRAAGAAAAAGHGWIAHAAGLLPDGAVRRLLLVLAGVECCSLVLWAVAPLGGVSQTLSP